MPSHPSKPKTLAGDPGLATAGGTPVLQSLFLQPVMPSHLTGLLWHAWRRAL